MPLKVVFLLATGTGLGIVAREVARSSPTALWILAVGVMVIAVIAGLMMLMQRLIRKSQSQRFAKVISPGKVSGGGTAQVRAQREDLRRRFVEGVDKLRDHGVDCYELPWYVVVGESGGGKTELLRRCGAAGSTSHGMTDPLQGVGGTLNMNWWFYNRAVILDTAGRLWEDRDNATSLSEWEEFLRLLVKYRRATPINGLILVIPATSLLRDRADAIDAKTATIVDQLQRMRNALEVRFPVYVVVSKCDLIPGFREFFEHIVQPDLQHQILGWSNRHDIDQPQQLDAPMEDARDSVGPKETFLTHELNRLVDRLNVRRLALLRDPGPTGPSGRRLDDVDGVFAFPEQLRTHVIPTLSQYVTKVFATGRYDRKPLFLRGVYLTSSMREGSPLDEDLARMLGKALDDFAVEEQAPREERAYFLTDLFDQKVFREPGLVSRSITPRRQFRRYRAALVGGALAGTVVLFTLTLLASRRFAAGLGDDLSLWRVAANACLASGGAESGERRDIPLVKPAAAASAEYAYAADVEVGPAKTRMSIAEYHRRLADTLTHEIRIPYLIRPFVKPSALDAVRRESQGILFHQKVVVPVITAGRARLVREAQEVPAAGPLPVGVRETTALLLRLERAPPASPSADAAAALGPFTGKDLDVLLNFVLVEGTDNWRRYAEKDPSREALLALFEQHMKSDVLWVGLRQGLSVEGERLVGNDAIAAGVDLLLGGYCTPQALRDSAPSLAAYNDLAALLPPWEAAERALLEVSQGLGPERAEWLQDLSPESVPGVRERWQQAYDEFKSRCDTVAALLARLETPVPDEPARRYAEAVKAAIGKARASVFGDVLRSLALSAGEERGVAGDDAFMQWLQRRLETRFAESAAALDDKALTTGLEALGRDYFDRVSVTAPVGASDVIQGLAQALGDRPAVYRLRAALYAEPARVMGATPPGAPPPATATPAEMLAGVTWLGAIAPNAYRTKEAAQAARAMIELGVAYHNTLAAAEMAKALPQTVDDVTSLIGRRADQAVPKPTIPFTATQGGSYEPRFNPAAAKAVLADWQARRDALRGLAPLLQRQALLAALARADECHALYLAPFCDYWLRDVPQAWEAAPFADWRSAQRAAASAKAWDICSGFEDVCGRMQALKESAIIDASSDERTRQRWQALLQEVEEVRRNVSSRAFVEQCDAVLRRWGQLPEDPEKARLALLALRATDFERDYFVFAPGAKATFVQRYWSTLTQSLLAALAKDSRQAIEPMVAALASYQRWPLNLPDGGAALSLDELGAARVLLQKFAVQPGDYPEGSMGMGGRATDPALDRLIKDLQRTPLPEPDEAWLTRATVVARLIPANARLQRTCKVQFASARPGDAYPFSRFWTWAVVRQGGKEVTQLNTADTSATFDLAWHPGDAVQIAFFLYPNDTEPDRVLTVDGPWAPLRLLVATQNPGAAAAALACGPGRPVLEGDSETTKATSKWLVPIVSTDPEGRRREIVLQLAFDQAITIEWPVK